MVSGYLLGFAALLITAGAWATGPAADLARAADH
jgi:hypothetical protein